MDREEAEALMDQIKAMPHFHVIETRTADDDNLFYTDALTRQGALEYAADLIAPIDLDSAELDDGERDAKRTYAERGQNLKAVWIVEAASTGCPLVHGDRDSLSYAEGESEGADKFLSNAMAQTPFWMAEGEPTSAEKHPAGISKLGEDDLYALELGDCFVIIKFGDTGVDITYPRGQLEKWQRRAYREDKTVDEIVTAAIEAAFGEIEEDP